MSKEKCKCTDENDTDNDDDDKGHETIRRKIYSGN